MENPKIYHWLEALQNSICTSPVMNVAPSKEMLREDGLLLPKQAYNQPYSGIPSQRSKDDSSPCYVRYDREYVLFWYDQKMKRVFMLDEALQPEMLSRLGLQTLKDALALMGMRVIKK